MKVKRINDPDEVKKSGPKELLFKKYGGNFLDTEPLRVNSPLVQELILYGQAKRGWGPNLYGVFDNGRIEELINCHTLTHEEAFTPEISKDLAKSFARFHSLQLPLEKASVDILENMFSSVDKLKNEVAHFLSNFKLENLQIKRAFERLHRFPFENEYKWIKSTSKKISQRIVLCSIDGNYLNRLVRDGESNDKNATQTIIIDFDVSCYSYRGLDISGHFINRMMDAEAKNGTLMSGFPYPSEEERTFFLTRYLEQCEKLFDDFDHQSLDSLDNLKIETDLNAFVFLIYWFIFALTFTKAAEQGSVMWTFLPPLLDLYDELKEQFTKSYPSLVCNDEL